MTEQDIVEQMASQVSVKQRRAILDAELTPEGFCVSQSAQEQECDGLLDLGITGKDGWADILTDDGLSVRALLEKQNG